ncbi:MAG TPA: alpha-amylase family protein [Armatimonadota bacterium]|jgi:hypothetical protein
MNLRPYVTLLAVAGLLGLALSCTAAAEPLPYDQTAVRLEARPLPAELPAAGELAADEQALGQAGCQSRWIRITTNQGEPLINNPYLPCRAPNAAQNEEMLKQWVADIHAAGMTAISWYNLTHCASAYQARPDWRQVYIGGALAGQTHGTAVCIESPYGQATIDYVNYAIEKLGLDGIWFDGTLWTDLGERPVALSCRCAACQAKYRADTGGDIPTDINWEDANYRRWVHWRYTEFSSYLGRLAAGIHAAHPQAAVMVNNYHRPNGTWRTSIPFEAYDAGIITATEGHNLRSADIVMRCCRAYLRPQSEVWTNFPLGESPAVNAEITLQHALTCFAGGVSPSFGSQNELSGTIPATLGLAAPVMKALYPYVGGVSVPYAAIHVSQQSDTFYFGRARPDAVIEPFWASLFAWTTGLEQEHFNPDYLFDSSLTPAGLTGYKVLFMPLSQALSPTQVETIVAWVNGGGTVVLGAGAGQLDADGQPQATNPLGLALGFSLQGVPGVEGGETPLRTLRSCADSSTLAVAGMYTPLTLQGAEWQVLYQDNGGSHGPVVAARTLGTGHVVVSAVDPASIHGPTMNCDGQTSITALAEGGRGALRFTDDPRTARPAYPSIDLKTEAFGAPDYAGGELSFDFRAERPTEMGVDIRSELDPTHGLGARFTAGLGTGKGKGVVVPVGQWVHVQMSYQFAGGGGPASFNVDATWPGGQRRLDRAAGGAAADYSRTDYLTMSSPGSEGVFDVANVTFAKIRPGGGREEILNQNADDWGQSVVGQAELVRRLAQYVRQFEAPPVQVNAPATVSSGVYTKEAGHTLVHLYNTVGLLGDWQRATGPRVTLRVTLPITSAKLLPSGQNLPLRQNNGATEIEVPPIGLYQVVDLS